MPGRSGREPVSGCEEATRLNLQIAKQTIGISPLSGRRARLACSPSSSPDRTASKN